jgi:hypothetical protein
MTTSEQSDQPLDSFLEATATSVAHPTSRLRPGSKRSQDVRREAEFCACGMQKSLTGVCSNCD